MLGGRSLCWHGVVLRIDDHALKKWPDSLKNELIKKEGLYDVIESELTEWKGGKLDQPNNQSEEHFLEGFARDNEWKIVPQVAKSYKKLGRRVWNSYSPLTAWTKQDLSRYQNQDLPKIHPGCLVSSIEKNTRNGVFTCHCTTRQYPDYSIRAHHCVLAAGTLENTRLHSSILHGESNRVYPYLHDHYVHGALIRLPENKIKLLSKDDRIFVMKSYPSLRGNLFLEVHADFRNHPTLDLWWKSEQELTTKSFVEIKKDNLGDTKGVIDSELAVKDMERISDQRGIIQAYLRSIGIDEIDHFFGDYDNGVKFLGNKQRGFYLNRLGTADHEAGTMPYGSVFDENGESVDISNLYLVGAAGFPASGYANPTLTVFCMARLVGRNICCK